MATTDRRRFALSLDFEDWYHLAYLERSACRRSVSVIDDLLPFFDQLRVRGIRATLFVLGALVERHAALLSELARRGHELAAHGWDHHLVDTLTDSAFSAEIARTRSVIESVSGASVLGFRAPCFRIGDRQLQLLADAGFRYDSSSVRGGHRARHGPALHGFSRISGLVQERDGFYEIELPSVRAFGLSLSVSGGGPFRLLPRRAFEPLFERHHRGGVRDFVFYVHPFELSERAVPLPPSTSALSRWRFAVGRAGNATHVLRFLDACRTRGYRFVTCRELIEDRTGANLA